MRATEKSMNQLQLGIFAAVLVADSEKVAAESISPARDKARRIAADLAILPKLLRRPQK
jgi:hypothetical protein